MNWKCQTLIALVTVGTVCGIWTEIPKLRHCWQSAVLLQHYSSAHHNRVTDNRTNWLVLRRHAYPHGPPTNSTLSPPRYVFYARWYCFIHTACMYKEFLIPVVFTTTQKFSISVYNVSIVWVATEMASVNKLHRGQNSTHHLPGTLLQYTHLWERYTLCQEQADLHS
jgi:hypothetical protein